MGFIWISGEKCPVCCYFVWSGNKYKNNRCIFLPDQLPTLSARLSVILCAEIPLPPPTDMLSSSTRRESSSEGPFYTRQTEKERDREREREGQRERDKMSGDARKFMVSSATLLLPTQTSSPAQKDTYWSGMWSGHCSTLCSTYYVVSQPTKDRRNLGIPRIYTRKGTFPTDFE